MLHTHKWHDARSKALGQSLRATPWNASTSSTWVTASVLMCGGTPYGCHSTAMQTEGSGPPRKLMGHAGRIRLWKNFTRTTAITALTLMHLKTRMLPAASLAPAPRCLLSSEHVGIHHRHHHHRHHHRHHRRRHRHRHHRHSRAPKVRACAALPLHHRHRVAVQAMNASRSITIAVVRHPHQHLSFATTFHRHHHQAASKKARIANPRRIVVQT